MGKNIAGFILQLKYPSVHDALLERDNLYQMCKTSNLAFCYCDPYGRKSMVPVDWYGNGKKTSFEDITVTIPERAELFLKQLYGDYMKYPPKEKRIPHHYAEVIDVNKPYLEYI